MAATVDVSDEVLSRYYVQEDPQITEQTRAILTQYSGIPDEEIINHIRTVRDKAWQRYKYPCIGLYNFLEFGISRISEYEEALSRVKDGETILDLGCCMGQDVRKLVFDGAPAENITASELEAEFIDLGFDLFLDKHQLSRTTFTTGDFFGPDRAMLTPQSFDIIHASYFFHLFSLSVQTEGLSLALRLLKERPGSLIFGRQIGNHRPELVRFKTSRSDEMYIHSVESFKKMVEDVRTQNAMNVIVEVETYRKPATAKSQDRLLMNYSIRLQ